MPPLCLAAPRKWMFGGSPPLAEWTGVGAEAADVAATEPLVADLTALDPEVERLLEPNRWTQAQIVSGPLPSCKAPRARASMSKLLDLCEGWCCSSTADLAARSPGHHDLLAAGAKRSGVETLLLRVRWNNGRDEWVPNDELHQRPQCLLKMVHFYESKVRAARPAQGRGGA